MNFDILEVFEEYLNCGDWRVKENSNMIYSFGGLTKHVASKATALYWESIYDKLNPDIVKGHRDGDYHIHDLGAFSSYCFGASLRTLLLEGIHGVPNISVSSPAKYLRSICSQIANITTIFQNENAGAIAYSSVNVYLAPFIYFDTLKRRKITPTGKKIEIEYTDDDIKEVKQSIQNMLFQLNSNSRMGAEPAFSNFTIDFKVLKPMRDMPVVYAGKHSELTYKAFQKEADMFTSIFIEVMREGDGEGKLLPYPIPTFNVSHDMDWDAHDDVFALAAETGAPYFGNFLHGSLKEDDVFSMCCRLRLDMKELMNKTGGLFGAAENTGSIGVFTVNLPALGHRSETYKDLISNLDKIMDLGYEHLEEKRRVITFHLRNGLYPALKTYLPREFTTFFTSFGLVGAHEMCLNFLGKGIETEEGVELTLNVIKHMKHRLEEFQEESGNLYNLEYTPSESSAYRLALRDKKRFSDIIQSGSSETPYYTNSTHLPVSIDWNWNEVFKHQEKLLPEATGGCVYHSYLKETITPEAAKSFIKTTLMNYNIPYLSLSPRYSVCQEGCGVLKGHQDVCSRCGGKTEVYQRITGYIRKISSFNDGKAQEYKERYQR